MLSLMARIFSWYADVDALRFAICTTISPKSTAKRKAPKSMIAVATRCWAAEPCVFHASPSSIASATYTRHQYSHCRGANEKPERLSTTASSVRLTAPHIIAHQCTSRLTHSAVERSRCRCRVSLVMATVFCSTMT